MKIRWQDAAAVLILLTAVYARYAGRSEITPAPDRPEISDELQKAIAPIVATAKGKDATHWGEVYAALAWAVRGQDGAFTYAQLNSAYTRLIRAYANEGLPKVEGLEPVIRKAMKGHLGDEDVPADKDRVAEFFQAVSVALGV